ncbi:L,D-transpeptidase family protein [Chelativorans salis]|uniref:L,D-TPase catalytic domain-containing protein n=1 Tax=Chelativorans salis TaxID=2978478 RepID=A0ABT2LQ64_9HYPH|nr:L,D-transpeptidase family protein [Chelativorans sp. EGI FJ00035]MCT7376471.1 hypothetical protein [Chelativorans sp. EGI FJ00035]
MRNKADTKDHNGYLFDKAIILQKCGRDSALRKGRRKAPVITVRARPGNSAQGLLSIDGRVFLCALGRGGVSALKREGDGATPLAVLRPLGVFHRPDRRLPAIAGTPLKTTSIRAGIGWCDAPGDPNYNRPVRLPYKASHEEMLRGDRLYDVCVVLDWNIRPRRRGRGSAIFLHMARPGMKPTEGCIAVAPGTMAMLLPRLSRRARIVVLR